MLPGIAGIRGFAGGASGPDNLADLFANGEVGDWWRFDNVHTNAASAGATCTSATGIINGRVLSSSNNAELQSSGGNFFLNMTSDMFIHNFGSTRPQPGTVIICVNDTDTTTHVVYSGSSSALRWQLSNSGSGDIILFAGATLDTTVNEGAGFGLKVVTGVFNGASSLSRFNGTQTATGNAGTQGTDRITLGALYDGTFGGSINVYSLLVIDRLLTASELDRAERLLGSHAGLTW